MNNYEKTSIKKRFAAIASARTGSQVSIEETKNGLGYTNKTFRIHLCFEHEWYETMTKNEVYAFLKGLFTHELMHLILTNFDEYTGSIKKIASRASRKIYQNILNICEDAFIENEAYKYIAKEFSDKLRYTRAIVYEHQPGLESLSHPMHQFITAILQYRFGGFLKGSFTFKEAEECFYKALPAFDRCTTISPTPTQQDRISSAKEIFELSRPLWKDDAENEDALEELLKEISKTMENFLMSDDEFGTGAGGGADDSLPSFSSSNPVSPMGGNTPDLSLAKRKEQTKKKPSEEASREMADELKKDIVLSSADIEEFKKIEKAAEKEKKSSAKKGTTYATSVVDVGNGVKNLCKNRLCQEIRVSVMPDSNNMAEYQSIVQTYANGIRHLANSLQRLLATRCSKRVYKRSGRIDVKRLLSDRQTPYLFRRMTKPEKANAAVVIAIDCSGSMSGEKILHAREMAICLAEVFAKINVPCFYMAFTADKSRYDANHFLFSDSWKNTAADRLNLLGLSAHSNNFDGYSIRYAAKLFKRMNADNKLLFVISDGTPNCRSYASDKDGILDTKMAIKEASKQAVTIGILLGNQKPKVHKEMYGNNFFPVKNVNDLFPEMGRILKKYL